MKKNNGILSYSFDNSKPIEKWRRKAGGQKNIFMAAGLPKRLDIYFIRQCFAFLCPPMWAFLLNIVRRNRMQKERK